jgi:hypothetical protein
MPTSFSTTVVRPLTLRALAIATGKTLDQLTGFPLGTATIDVFSVPVRPAIREHIGLPLDEAGLDTIIEPRGAAGDASVEAFFRIRGFDDTGCGVAIAFFGETVLFAEPWKSPLGYLLGVAVIIAGSRDFGNGIDESHDIYGDRPMTEAPISADELDVLRYLQEPPGKHSSLGEAAEAVLAKTGMRQPTRGDPSHT